MISKEGYSLIAGASFLAIILVFIGLWLNNRWSWVLYITGVLIVAFFLNFFRDPERTTPSGADLLIAPADGKIVLIKQVQEDKYIGGPATQVSIFLSAFDVHVNRIPLSGVIEYAAYNPGEYLLAWHEKASELNEQSLFGVRHASGTKVMFKQITGYVARRIVFHIGEGDTVEAGERFGMMKFGSRMDIIVPATVQLNVQEGQRTVAGETILGKVLHE